MLDADFRVTMMHTLFAIHKEPGLSKLLEYLNKLNSKISSSNGHHASLSDIIHIPDQLMQNSELSDTTLDADYVYLASDTKVVKAYLNGAIKETGIKNLDILGSGGPQSYKSELVFTESLKILLQDLLQKFDVIMIDSAPLMLVPDTTILSSLVDGVLMVVDSGKYDEQMLLQAKNQLQSSKANVLGIVLNNVEVNNLYKKYKYYYEPQK